MTAQQTADCARRWFQEVWNDRREATIEEFLTPASVCHADQGDLQGIEAFRLQQYEPFIGAFPDLEVTVEDVLASGEQAVVRWSARGRHQGPHLGLPATNQVVTISGMTWMRFQDGKLLEGWQTSSIPEVLRQLSGGI
ncbi:MAG TPA: ester cyclase [Caulifigura sp.]|nr:ester cyclase [Caulifigura sp.]